MNDEVKKKISLIDELMIEDIRLRDEADKVREISPLIPADDSVEVNSSNLTPQEVLKIVLEIYKEKI